MMDKSRLNRIIRDIKNFIELEKESGLDEFMLKGVTKPKQASGLDTGGVARDRKTVLDELRTQAQECRECPLCKSRRNLVFGSGDPGARLMFVGEAPGLEEDIKGEPFVGKAGALLTKIIEAIGLKREDVYIANCLKCRPPKNRDPLPSEVIACREFLRQQVDIIRPKVICCLGKFSAQTLLMSEESISRLRGRFYDFEGTKLMPTFHPAYLLRNPSEKRHVWEDMKKIRDYLSYHQENQ